MTITYLKSATLFIGVFLFFIITYLFFELVFGLSGIFEQFIQNNLTTSLFTAFVIVLLLVADILIPVPASIVMMTSGILFGPFVGGLVVLAGSLTGAILTFELSRVLGREKVKRWLGHEEYTRVATIMQGYGALAIILTRMVPLATESVSAIAGLSQMTRKKFVAVNIIGFVPTGFFYSYTGYRYQNEPDNLLLILFIGFFIPLFIWVLLAKMNVGRN